MFNHAWPEFFKNLSKTRLDLMTLLCNNVIHDYRKDIVLEKIELTNNYKIIFYYLDDERKQQTLTYDYFKDYIKFLRS
ncbi:MAG: hypothetical protein ACTSWG_13180 [Candidatus Helarchaeota archaeon]